jgi:hypothetical protein
MVEDDGRKESTYPVAIDVASGGEGEAEALAVLVAGECLDVLQVCAGRVAAIVHGDGAGALAGRAHNDVLVAVLVEIARRGNGPAVLRAVHRPVDDLVRRVGEPAPRLPQVE